MIYENLESAFEDGSDLKVRQNMQRATFWAGRAFTRGCVGYVHAIGQTLGGLYGVAHGEAMAALLPHVLRAYGSAVHHRLAELADACGIPGSVDVEKAQAFIRWIDEINCKMGIPSRFPMIKEQDIDRMITWAIREANPLYPVPVVWGRKEFRSLIESIR